MEQPYKRFVYVGVCNANKLVANGLRGSYNVGGGMISIRQNFDAGKSAVCLHDSLEKFSD